MTIPDSLNAKGQSHVEDVLKFFVTTRPTSFAGLELPVLSEELPEQRQSLTDALLRFLQDLSTCRLPGAVVRNHSEVASEKWACRNFTVCTTVCPSGSP